MEGAVERGPPALAVTRDQGRARVHESSRDGRIATHGRRVEGGDVAGTASVHVRAVRLQHARQTDERLLRGTLRAAARSAVSASRADEPAPPWGGIVTDSWWGR